MLLEFTGCFVFREPSSEVSSENRIEAVVHMCAPNSCLQLTVRVAAPNLLFCRPTRACSQRPVGALFLALFLCSTIAFSLTTNLTSEHMSWFLFEKFILRLRLVLLRLQHSAVRLWLEEAVSQSAPELHSYCQSTETGIVDLLGPPCAAAFSRFQISGFGYLVVGFLSEETSPRLLLNECGMQSSSRLSLSPLPSP